MRITDINFPVLRAGNVDNLHLPGGDPAAGGEGFAGQNKNYRGVKASARNREMV